MGSSPDSRPRLAAPAASPKKPAAAPAESTKPDGLRKTVDRLKRAQSQLAAVIAVVESGADCRAVVTQLAAVSSAIDRGGFTIISTAMKECLTDPDTDGATRPMRVEELEKLFLALSSAASARGETGREVSRSAPARPHRPRRREPVPRSPV